MNINSFWGKTNLGAGDMASKPVIHHLLDVAASALRLQQCNMARTIRDASRLDVERDDLVRISAWLAGLHDIGKFAKSFQCKVPALWPVHALGPIDPKGYAVRPHWRSTAFLLRAVPVWNEFSALFPNLEDGREALTAAVAGHHGMPPDSEEFNSDPWSAASKPDIGRISIAAALEALQILTRIIDPSPITSLRTLEKAREWSWRIAGLTTVADWVGSDSDFFEFENSAMPAGAYWPLALERADKALKTKGLVASPARRGGGLSTIAPDLSAPRPMQLAADVISLPEGPMLVIIEDTTGSGKTEAALALAARMIAAGKAEGLYFALPTMATANAMYGRLVGLDARIFADGADTSLVLAHGKSHLSDAFMRTIGLARSGSDSEDAAATCTEWIADSRRKAFFGDVGAGTVDQAFLSVLRKKHLTLRQYGLAARVLIVDEAHAFDAYMSRELETLLQAHAAVGGSAVVLSATLPTAMRHRICNAFRKGLHAPAGETQADAYPLLTCVSAAGIEERAVSFAEPLRREVAIERIADAEAAHERALEAARKGAAVLLIRNAVDTALASFGVLRGMHAETHLFHARFAVCDRQRIEEEMLGRFGREATQWQRAGHILVATQVVEQSLDLDFDLVISDLAPIDLLIQRAGRLWRHMDRRPQALRPIEGPRLVVISPPTAEATHEKWLEGALGPGSFVYGHPGLMWRTAKAIEEEGAIRAPDNLRSLIARVYDQEDIPECLRNLQDKAEGEEFGHKHLANMNLIEFARGYADVGTLSVDQEIGTRLGEETVVIRLARLVHNRVVPWAPDTIDRKQSPVDPADLWAFSEVTVRKNWLASFQPPREFAAAIEALKADWPEWERSKIVAVVEGNSVRLEGMSRDLTYDDAEGLRRLMDEDMPGLPVV